MKRKNASIIHELVISVLKECDFTLEGNQLKLFTALNQLSRQIPTTDILGYLLNDSLDLRCITDPNWFKFIAQVFIMSTSFRGVRNSKESRTLARESILESQIRIKNH
jgi:hypothetical protein